MSESSVPATQSDKDVRIVGGITGVEIVLRVGSRHTQTLRFTGDDMEAAMQILWDMQDGVRSGRLQFGLSGFWLARSYNEQEFGFRAF